MRQAARINLKTKDDELIRQALVTAENQGKVKIGRIAVIGSREWLRISPVRFHKTCRIEIG